MLLRLLGSAVLAVMAFSMSSNFSRRSLFALSLLLAAGSALAQNAVLQTGPWTPGHVAIYANPGSSLPTIEDSANFGASPTITGGACGSVTFGTVSGSDVAGTLLVGTSNGNVTSCAITFTSLHTAAPSQCQLTSENSTAANWTATGAYVSSLTPQGFAITGLNLAGAQYGFFCL